MTESIYIKNLGPLKDVHIQNIKPFTVLIGESGSGKSTLMKAIALFRWIYKMHNIRSYLKHSKISKSPFRFRMETYLKNCGFEQFIKADTEIVYTTTFDENRSYEITFSKYNLSGTGNDRLINKDDIYFNKVSFISETRNIIPLWSDKGASFSGGYLGFYFHEVYRDFDLASETLKELELKFLNLKFAVKRTNSGKKYTIQSSTKEDFEIDFKNSSSGTQTSVPISLITQYFSKKFNFEDAFNRSVLNYLSNTDNLTDFKAVKNLSEINKKIFIHIEEPELSLFPDAQTQLINDLVNKCFITNDNSIELFLSTHSPYIINHLNLLIKAFDKDKLIDGAKFNYDNLAVYQVVNGKLENLIAQNERLVNTNPLSETINNIYDQYAALD
ncbi:MAG TPA: AAA family ATPase [Chitinophagaceae bacterium]|jgi:predicted ATPase|nr:AAA family ATPase [Chitinophagaceae bacterium]HMU57461.1 AAA family ATPase [Chitinophagaceae bacterium]